MSSRIVEKINGVRCIWDAGTWRPATLSELIEYQDSILAWGDESGAANQDDSDRLQAAVYHVTQEDIDDTDPYLDRSCE
jgi:hypothetical protein